RGGKWRVSHMMILPPTVALARQRYVHRRPRWGYTGSVMTAMSRGERIGRLLNERGYALTPGRRVVVETLADRETTFTASEVVSWVDQVDPGIGRATVFRTLDLLLQVGVLDRIHSDDGSHGYAVCVTPEHHHHLVCRNCNRVILIQDCDVEDVSKRIAQQHGFTVERHQMEIFGLCPACQVG
ncbi:MAG: transcriptional repressor, partial [Thermomicrobium sp.]|nr:transcriptional repressor [Thermomicrobium sp.]